MNENDHNNVRSGAHNKIGFYVTIIGLICGMVLAFIVRSMLLMFSDIEVPILSAITTGAFWGFVFGIVNALLIHFFRSRSERNRWRNSHSTVYGLVFVANFFSMFLLNFFWFLPLPDLYYYIGVGILTSITAVLAVRYYV